MTDHETRWSVPPPETDQEVCPTCSAPQRLCVELLLFVFPEDRLHIRPEFPQEVAAGTHADVARSPLEDRRRSPQTVRAPQRGDGPTAVIVGQRRIRRGIAALGFPRHYGEYNDVIHAPEEVALAAAPVAGVLFVNRFDAALNQVADHELPVERRRALFGSRHALAPFFRKLVKLIENGARRSSQQRPRANQVPPESTVRWICGSGNRRGHRSYRLLRLRLLRGRLFLCATYSAQKSQTQR